MKRLRRLLCFFGRHHPVFRIGYPGFFRGDPDQFTICKCRSCQRSWLEPPR